MFISVDLPAPLLPITVTKSPGFQMQISVYESDLLIDCTGKKQLGDLFEFKH